MSTMVEGGCFCGSVRYRVHARPMIVHCCHCRNCQSQTGSAFVINALVETEKLETLSGRTVIFTVKSGSGKPHDIYRCAECGTAVWSDYGRKRGIRFVRVGTLDDPTVMPPNVHIFTRSKLPWVRLPDDVPAFEVFYDPDKVWSPESRDRRNRARSDR